MVFGRSKAKTSDDLFEGVFSLPWDDLIPRKWEVTCCESAISQIQTLQHLIDTICGEESDSEETFILS